MIKINIKVISVFLILLYVVMVLFFYNFYKNLVIKDAKQEVITVLKTTKAIRNYVENVQKPVIYKLKKEGKLYKDFFDPKLLSSSYIVSRIYKLQNDTKSKENITPYTYKLVASNPRNPKNRADKFERKILNKFRTENIQEFSTILKEHGKNYFFVAIPVTRNKKSCMKCHGTPDIAPKEMLKIYGKTAGFHEKIGDLRAMISLKIPIAHIVSTHIKDFFITIFIAFVVFVIFFIFIYIIYIKNLKFQKERELLLMHQNRLASMGEMIGNIAHQWKQPLAQLSFILVNIELFSEKNRLTKYKLKSKIDEANKQISFMSNTIDDFRNFFASGKPKESYAIKDVIILTKQLVNAALDKNKIKLKINIKTNFIIKGYKNEIIQALINIINNSKDALLERNSEKPLISIKVFLENNHKIITIQDNAGGINISPIEKIFEPYFTTKHTDTGTGIGLYMTKAIIEKNNNGNISVKNLHNGAIFTIIF